MVVDMMRLVARRRVKLLVQLRSVAATETSASVGGVAASEASASVGSVGGDDVSAAKVWHTRGALRDR